MTEVTRKIFKHSSKFSEIGPENLYKLTWSPENLAAPIVKFYCFSIFPFFWGVHAAEFSSLILLVGQTSEKYSKIRSC